MASKYFINGGVDHNWGTASNWASVDGGTHTTETVPASTDDVLFTSNSPNCTVNTSTRNALSLDFTGYTNTITMTQQITVAGSVTLSAGMTVSGTGLLNVAANGAVTLTSNGKTWPGPLSITLGITVTLADNWTVAGLLTLGSSISTATINGNQITCTGGLRFGGTTGLATGTTVLLLTAAQTIDAPSITTGRGLLLPVTINAPGATITFSGATIPINIGILTVTAAGSIISNSVAWPLGSGGSGGAILSRVMTGY